MATEFNYQKKQQLLKLPDENISATVKGKIKKLNKKAGLLEEYKQYLPQLEQELTQHKEGSTKHKKTLQNIADCNDAINELSNEITGLDNTITADIERLYSNKDRYAADALKLANARAKKSPNQSIPTVAITSEPAPVQQPTIIEPPLVTAPEPTIEPPPPSDNNGQAKPAATPSPGASTEPPIQKPSKPAIASQAPVKKKDSNVGWGIALSVLTFIGGIFLGRNIGGNK